MSRNELISGIKLLTLGTAVVAVVSLIIIVVAAK